MLMPLRYIKSQGNEFPAVIMPMFPGPPQLYYRNLLYTGITRAKNMVILVGMERTVHTMVENDRKKQDDIPAYIIL